MLNKVFGVTNDEIQKDSMDIELNNLSEEELEEETGQVALDVLESQDSLYIIAPIAGVLYEDIDISLNKTVLTIKGKRPKPKEYTLEGIEIKNSECFWGNFVRNIILPENLGLDKIKAYMENNLLTVIIPKLRFNSQSIKINRMEV